MWTGFKQIRQTSAWKWMVHPESILRMTLCLIMSDIIMTIIMTISSLWIIHLPFLRPSSSWLFDRSLSFFETDFICFRFQDRSLSRTVHFESFGPSSLIHDRSISVVWTTDRWRWYKTVQFRLDPIFISLCSRFTRKVSRQKQFMEYLNFCSCSNVRMFVNIQMFECSLMFECSAVQCSNVR